MPCHHVQIGDATAIVCTARQRRRRCFYCPAWSTVLCDFPTPKKKGRSKTCDRPCCSAHATHVGEDRDYCDPKQNRQHPRVPGMAEAA